MTTATVTHVNAEEWDRAVAKAQAKAVEPRYVNVRTWDIRTKAYADSTGIVRVYDPIAGYYTTCHSLTDAQLRYVRAKTMPQRITLPTQANR